MANVSIRDVKLPFEETPGGDLAIVESRALASQRIVYGLTTEVGAIVHRPDYKTYANAYQSSITVY